MDVIMYFGLGVKAGLCPRFNAQAHVFIVLPGNVQFRYFFLYFKNFYRLKILEKRKGVV